MPIEKEDHRIRVTKKIIKDAFLALLKDKPIKDISVKELCASADINRSTFYFHYLDVYDLLEKVEQEMLDDLNRLLNNSSYDLIALSNSIYLEIFNFISRHIEMCEILLVKNSDPTFMKKIFDLGHEKFVKVTLLVNPKVDKEKLEYFYSDILYGYLGIISRWIENGMKESVKEIAEIARQITTEGISVIS